jgi:ribulose-phosphate 3-epimerase
MATICPTVLASTPEEFAREMARVGFAPRIQVDLSDGEFSPTRTINLNRVYFNENQLTDLHLMLKKPLEWLEMIVSLKPHMAIFHAETVTDAEFLKADEHLARVGVKVGVAILPETTAEAARAKISTADHVLIFGGHLGFMGGEAQLDQLEKVRDIRALKPDVEIGWDGGANASNVAAIAAGGVDVINVGSAIMKSDDPEKSYAELTRIVAKKTEKC